MHESATKPFTGDPIEDEYDIMVLLVDDQALVGEAIRRALVPEPDIKFHFCIDGRKAIEAASRVRPTVILQDLVMPDVDGLALVREYRSNAETRDIPVIVLSTMEQAAVKRNAFAIGANDYLVKLPDNIELIARIRYHSRAYINLLQRDAASRALRESQQELLAKNIELSRLINVDGLTGLNNRRYFNEVAEAEWKRATRESGYFGIAMIDVDDFKRYNDTYGHVAGDEVLKRIAAVIRDSTHRASDVTARYGGEEFVAILPGTPPHGVLGFAEKLCQGVRQLAIPHIKSSVGGVASVSIGTLSIIPEQGMTLVGAIEAADAALYDAKRLGKDRVVQSELTVSE